MCTSEKGGPKNISTYCRHDTRALSSCIISTPPYAAAAAEGAGAVARVGRGQQQQQQEEQQQQQSERAITEAGVGGAAAHYVAQADGIPSCRLLCCCLRSWHGSGGTACSQLCRRHRCWAAVTTPSLFFFCVSFFSCLPRCCTHTPTHPHFSPRFRWRCLQDLVVLVRQHIKIMMGRGFTFFTGRKAIFNFLKTFFRPHYPGFFVVVLA